MNRKKPYYQTLLIYIFWILAGFLALGSLLDSIGNAVTLITPSITVVGTLLILTAWLLTELMLKRSPVRWSTKDGHIIIKKLGWKVRLSLVGMILLLWVPRISSGDDAISFEPAITNIRNSTSDTGPTSTSSPTPKPTPTLLPSPTPTPTILFPVSPISPISSPTPTALFSPTKVLTPSIEKVIIGQSDNDYKIQVTLLNPLSENLLVTNVKIGQTITGKQDIRCNAFEPPVTYEILSNIVISDEADSGFELKPEISPNGELSGHTYEGKGEMSNNCIDQFVRPRRQYKLDLSFDTSLVLSRNNFTNFFIIMPKHFNLQNTDPEHRSLQQIPLQYSFVEPENPEDFEEYNILIEVMTNYSHQVKYTLNLLP